MQCKADRYFERISREEFLELCRRYPGLPKGTSFPAEKGGRFYVNDEPKGKLTREEILSLPIGTKIPVGSLDGYYQVVPDQQSDDSEKKAILRGSGPRESGKIMAGLRERARPIFDELERQERAMKDDGKYRHLHFR